MLQTETLAPPPAAASETTAQDQRRTHILEAARRCFAVNGFHSSSMHQVCAEARMSPGALYRYFPSKEAIIEAIAEDERVKAGQCLAALDGPGPLIDRLVVTFVGYLEHVRATGAGMLMVEICAESMRNTVVGARFRGIETEVFGLVERTLARARDAGEIPADLDLEMATVMMMSLGDGLATRMGLDATLEPSAIEPFIRRTIAAILGLVRPVTDA